MPIIPALVRLRQEDWKFKVSLGYMVRLCLEATRKHHYLLSSFFSFFFLLCDIIMDGFCSVQWQSAHWPALVGRTEH